MLLLRDRACRQWPPLSCARPSPSRSLARRRADVAGKDAQAAGANEWRVIGSAGAHRLLGRHRPAACCDDRRADDRPHYPPQARRLALACSRRRDAQCRAAEYGAAIRPRDPDAEPRPARVHHAETRRRTRTRSRRAAARRAFSTADDLLSDRRDRSRRRRRRFRDGVFIGVKLYPANATTNSAAGVTDDRNIVRVVERMEKIGMPLLMHGEEVGANRHFRPRSDVHRAARVEVVKEFPALRMTTGAPVVETGAEFVKSAAPQVGGTITPIISISRAPIGSAAASSR